MPPLFNVLSMPLDMKANFHFTAFTMITASSGAYFRI